VSRTLRVLTGDDERPLAPAALIVVFVLVSMMGGLVAAGLAVPALAAANVGADVAKTTFDGLTDELADVTLPQRTEVYANDRTYAEDGTVTNAGTLLATFYTQNRVIVPLPEINHYLQEAVVATEDKRFREHNGVDPQGMATALVEGLVLGDTQRGASTITQQYVKNVLIQEALDRAETDAQRQAAYTEATVAEGTEGYVRKLREARLAIALENRLTAELGRDGAKERILEDYLNIAQFGASSVYGAEAAAWYYFSKSAADPEFTYLEAATIAGVTKNPTNLDPRRFPKESETRRNVVLALMHEQGYIDDEQYTTGIATPLEEYLNPSDTPVGCSHAEEAVHGSGYFCDWVSKIVVKDKVFGETAEVRAALWQKGGLTITTTLDPRLQPMATEEVQRSVPAGDPSGVVQAMAVVEPGTGQVKALAQSTNWTATNREVAGESAINLNVAQPYYNNQGFQPGSTFKAFTLLAWLEAGHSLGDVVDGTPRSFQMSQFTSCDGRLGGRSFFVGNSPPNAGGAMSVQDATRNSVNGAFMAMATRLNLCTIMGRAADLGVVQANPKHLSGEKKGQPLRGDDGEYIPVPFNDHFPINVIGTDNTTTLQMAGAFAAFASGGIYCTPVAITKVVDTKGQERPVPDAGCKQEIDPAVANTIARAMSGVWGGTMSSVGSPGFPAAGKTGTSNNNEYTWFVGYTPRLAAAVAVSGSLKGFETANRKTIGGHRYSVVYGATIAGPTWKRFAVAALNDGQPNPGFGEGSPDLIYGRQVSVPDVTGKSVDEATTTLRNAGFTASVAPDQVASLVPAGLVAQQSPTGTATSGSVVVLTVSNGQPPGHDPGADRDRRGHDRDRDGPG